MKSSQQNMASAKAVASLFILLVAFGIFLIFQKYQDVLTQSGSLKLFVALAIIAGGFLFGLLYLVSQSTHKEAKVTVAKTARKKVKSKPSKKKKSR